MSFLATVPIIGDVINGVKELISETITDKDKAMEINSAIDTALINADVKKFSDQINAQMNIIVAEAQGKSWLQRNWRPGLMALFGIIIANNYILHPYLSALFDVNVMMPIPEQMWSLLKLGVSGYIVGRSVEKGIDTWKKK